MLFNVVSLTWFSLLFVRNICFEENYNILEGHYAKEGEFPWIASVISTDSNFLCAAVFIDKQWVVVAAHCVTCESSLKCGVPDHVHFGSIHKHNNFMISIDIPVIHPKYNSSVNENDIALLKLHRPIGNSPLTQVIEFADIPDGKGNDNNCMNVGWGMPCKNSYISTDTLYYFSSPIIPEEECKSSWIELSIEKVCSKSLSSNGYCVNEAGNPLVCDNKLFGLTSFGHVISASATPIVYTKVAHFKEWIDEVIQKH